MTKTIIDMPKVCQMLDAGWHVTLFKNQLRSYTAIGRHRNPSMRENAILDNDGSGEVTTDDFTPEQALTRLAYKVHGEIL